MAYLFPRFWPVHVFDSCKVPNVHYCIVAKLATQSHVERIAIRSWINDVRGSGANRIDAMEWLRFIVHAEEPGVEPGRQLRSSRFERGAVTSRLVLPSRCKCTCLRHTSHILATGAGNSVGSGYPVHVYKAASPAMYCANLQYARRLFLIRNQLSRSSRNWVAGLSA